MKLNSNRLVLRDVTLKDAKDIAKNANDKLNHKYISEIPYPYSIKDARKFINQCIKSQKKKPREEYSFGIFLKSEKKIIGMIDFFSINLHHRRAEIGYWIGKDYRKMGLISEAERTMLDFAFNKLKLNKISGECIIENKGSAALFKKFGFRKIGIEKEERIIDGKKKDAYCWELLKSNYKTK